MDRGKIGYNVLGFKAGRRLSEEARDERMQGYLTRINHLQKKFESFDLQHIPRGGNTHADSLATLVTSLTQNLSRVILI